MCQKQHAIIHIGFGTLRFRASPGGLGTFPPPTDKGGRCTDKKALIPFGSQVQAALTSKEQTPLPFLPPCPCFIWAPTWAGRGWTPFWVPWYRYSAPWCPSSRGAPTATSAKPSWFRSGRAPMAKPNRASWAGSGCSVPWNVSKGCWWRGGERRRCPARPSLSAGPPVEVRPFLSPCAPHTRGPQQVSPGPPDTHTHVPSLCSGVPGTWGQPQVRHQLSHPGLCPTGRAHCQSMSQSGEWGGAVTPKKEEVIVDK